MKIQLFIAVSDSDYLEHLSQVLIEQYEDIFEVSVCSQVKYIEEMTKNHQFDVALLSSDLAEQISVRAGRLMLYLWDGTENRNPTGKNLIQKYQRISAIVREILQQYAVVSSDRVGLQSNRGRITAVWSPSGGCGKTTVSLAYAAQKVSEGRKIVYLDLEPFSSVSLYFAQNGKSLSSVFEHLDGNVELFLRSIQQVDDASGIFYFCRPDNYDDIQALTSEDLTVLANAAAEKVDELVLDLGSTYDLKIRSILELADRVLLVSDSSRTSQIKLEQFRSQNDMFEKIEKKIVLILNKGNYKDPQNNQAIVLPQVQSEDPVIVYKTLSGGYFQQ